MRPSICESVRLSFRGGLCASEVCAPPRSVRLQGLYETDEEEPFPRPPASTTVEVANAVSDDTTKSTCSGVCAVEDGHPSGQLFGLVPHAQQQVTARIHASFRDPERQAYQNVAVVALDDAGEDGDHAPGADGDREPDFGTDPAEHDVADGLGQTVGEEENGEGQVELGRGHADIGQKTEKFRITRVRLVERAQQVEERQCWKQTPVDCAHDQQGSRRFIMRRG